MSDKLQLSKKDRNFEFFFNNPLVVATYSLFVFVIVNLLMIFMFVYNYHNSVTDEIKKNIFEYEEVDLSHLCGLYNCKYINYDNVTYRNVNHNISEYPKLERSNVKLSKDVIIFSKVFLTKDFDVLIEVNVNNYFNGFLVVAKKNLFDIINNVYYYALTSFMTFNILLLIINILGYKKFQLRHNIMLQTEGYYKSMMMLTENIHHELNTPMSVMNKKIMKLRNKLLDNNNGPLCDLEIKKDLDLIEASLQQMSDLVVRMRPFKDLKKQTTSDLRTIIRTSCDIMGVSQHERFDYDVSIDFMEYKLNTQLLKKGEFTAIILNLIKNSIDANTHLINFKIKKYDEKHKKLHFYIADNGNGIPLDLQSSIFKEDVSSKSKNRGNGLFINKYILNSSNGDIKLHHSSKEGTVFEIIIPVIKLGDKK
jgi:signal transduction histidine kinase